MTSRPPPLEVSSASFFQLECSHAQLFQPEYKRSNRTKGLKILRCFPHCCPEHIDRSYCGTSLSVRVQLRAVSASESPPLDLFARFETVSDVSLRPGECVEVDRIQVATQTETNPEGQWMKGILDQPSKLVAAIRAADASSDEKPLVFHLNSRSYARWYYDWESGANKAQRLMKHALKAYVVERCAVDKDDRIVAVNSRDAVKRLYRVLEVVTSPEFTVVSYRRAPQDNYYPGAVVGGGMSPYGEASSYQGASPVGSYDGAYARPSTPKSAHWRTAGDAKPDAMYTRPYQSKRQRTSTPPARRVELEDVPDLLEDKLRWEHMNLPAVSVSRNLALVYSFVRWAPLSVYASFVDELVHLVNDSVLGSLAGSSQRASRLNCFSKLLFNQARSDGDTAVAGSFVHGKRGVGGAPAALPRDLKTLLQVLADAALWFFSTDTRLWMRSFFRQHARFLLDKDGLRESFVLFLQELQTRLDAQVFSQTPLQSLANAAEEVIAAVYSYEYFHARRPRVRRILSGQSFAGWNAFVAQMRETYIGMTSFPGVSRQLMKSQSELDFEQAHPPQNSVERAWNAEWLLDVDEAMWKPSENAIKVDIHDLSGFGDIDSDDGAVSLFTLFDIISQMVRIEVGIDIQARTLHVRSTQGVAGSQDCMRLVLDGKDRVFSQFPNAMATEANTGACGDYIGEVQVGKSGRLIVYLQMFSWSMRGNGPSYHSRMRIECWHSQRLCISGDVLATTALASFPSEEALYLPEMSLRNKREAVENTYMHQLRDDPGARSAAGPWKEIGRFRLSYIKA
ncbi:hypothetical protein PF005_g2055 [Phytophthora fragariae]|uniref:Uncharacterized protein n=1 Tax=Phytophthora fragariae TaxID=53985 RepID=A0A6A3URY6_9STRA|nr:hypothetical protein PF003_g3280 [Phytophthora fragariae]KAE8948243.1 hypothetical protein PF009_g2172 [Phytophthora fragariae]KAE9136729.1 hypothetical protein PF007_g2072 [Phytophthora fragariae]KAE9154355.1 hypothetical protein PF006_g1599 [Phytophthora fragariae]KAE9178795.1 hypothetical protein PF004_g25372 [Phytophthora fragariae]